MTPPDEFPPVEERLLGTTTTLVDAVDRLIDRGTVLRGGALLSVAGVDLVRLDLGLLLGAVEDLEPPAPPRPPSEPAADPTGSPPPSDPAGPAPDGTDGTEDPSPAPRPVSPPEDGGSAGGPAGSRDEEAEPAGPIDVDPDDAGRGLAHLVLTLVEFLRQVLERQAIRRMDGGRLDDETLDRLGRAFARLEEKVQEMVEVFGLEDEPLDIDLGPLGRLNGPAHRRTEV